MKKDIHEVVGERLGKLFDLYPIDLSTASSREVQTEMREGLAQAFAINGYRKFLENAVRATNQSLIRSFDEKHTLYYKGRMDTLMQLLAASRANFVSNALKQKTIKEKSARVVAAEKELVNEHGTV